jgi:mannose-6-phosphate isomerase
MLYKMTNPVRRYAWGSTTAIPALRGEAPDGQPQAELWMGAHPGDPSTIQVGNSDVPLNEHLAEPLPFLFKVLAADKVLSVQTHPNKAQGEAGFAKENALGIALDAPNRSYRDANHKPEIICALTGMQAMCGFRTADQIRANLTACCAESLALELAEFADSGDIRRLFRALLQLPEQRRAAVFAETLASADSADRPELIRDIAEQYPGDIGITAPLLLNVIDLAPGEALATQAGVMHAYIKGVGIELMANCDNVLRGGLTQKYIDIDELMTCGRFEALAARPTATTVDGAETVYHADAEEFTLSRIELDDEAAFRAWVEGPEILLCVDGEAGVTDADCNQQTIRSGESLFVDAESVSYAVTGPAVLFRAR